MADNSSGNLVETIKAIGEDIRLLSTTIMKVRTERMLGRGNGKNVVGNGLLQQAIQV